MGPIYIIYMHTDVAARKRVSLAYLLFTFAAVCTCKVQLLVQLLAWGCGRRCDTLLYILCYMYIYIYVYMIY